MADIQGDGPIDAEDLLAGLVGEPDVGEQQVPEQPAPAPAEQELGQWVATQVPNDQVPSNQPPVHQVPSNQAMAAAPVLQPLPGVATGANDERGRGLKFALLGLLFLAVIAGAGAVGWLLANSDTDDPAAPAATTLPEGDEEVAAPTSEPADGTTTEPSTESTGAPSSSTPEVDPLTGEAWPDDLSGYTRSQIEEYNYPRTIVKGTTVTLQGRMPSQEMIDRSVERSKLGGLLTVVEEMEVDPNIPFYDNAPVYADDVVNFEFGSADIADEFFPVLDLGVTAMTLNPGLIGVIVAHTDAVGSAETNLEMATNRANSVKEYWMSKGVKEEQIEIDARGEEFATEDADPAIAARDRRVEFAFKGFFG